MAHRKPSARSPRVLLCAADVGCGHARAASAVALGMRSLRPGMLSPVVDALATTPAWFNLLYRDAYLSAARRLPRLNGWLYASTDVPGALAQRGIGAAVEARALRRFCSSPEVREADLIVTTHFLCARVLSRLRGCGELNAKLAVVVTDQHPHAVWRVPHADLFMVASDAAAEEMARHGVPAERVIVTGIPIDPRFSEPMSQRVARAKHALPQDASIVLVSGGGLGLGGLDHAIEGILASGVECFTVVVCGRNEALRKQLARRYGALPDRVGVLGLTTRMHELMAAADVLVGKPGGLSTSEAAALGLPMVLLRPIPGQEERNADALVAAGAAVLHLDPFTAGSAAAKLVDDDGALDELRACARSFGRPTSALAAAKAALALIEATPATTRDDHVLTALATR